ncbi:MAG: EamA family transporter [Candidatus Rokuibacteriota bacterium]
MLTGPGLAILSALLFGASTPVAKILLGQVDPWLLAGLLYLGSGLGLAVLVGLRRTGWRRSAEASVGRAQAGWLALAILAGGILAPVLLMLGLARTPATTAALLLNLEGVFTAILAWFVFGENVDRRIALGMAAIVSGAVIVSWQGAAVLGSGLGPLAIAGACLAWALDNNFTRKVALSDPVQVTLPKGCIAGTLNVAIATSLGAPWPGPGIAAAAGAVGFLGYGVSLVLFVLALRHVGSARTGAYFSLAPFFGAVISTALLREPLSMALLTAGALMGLGVWLHLTERHDHEHEHAELAHDHIHVHDEHHQHEHTGPEPSREPHSHRHVHTRLRHAHRHYPDLHHRHPH